MSREAPADTATVFQLVAEPFQLWSLREIMRIVDAKDLIHITYLLAKINTLALFDQKLAVKDGEAAGVLLKTLETTCDALDLPMTKGALGWLRDSLAQSPQNPVWIQQRANDVYNRMAQELDLRRFLYVPTDRSAFYSDPLARWGSAVAVFDASRFDIEEASKCFALARHTACAFHLMRAIEPVLQNLKGDLNVTSKTNTWDTCLRELDSANQRQNGQQAASGPFLNRARFDWFSESVAHLRNIKHAWRNSTMHEPERIYTEEQARDLYTHVATFMSRIAAGAP